MERWKEYIMNLLDCKDKENEISNIAENIPQEFSGEE